MSWNEYLYWYAQDRGGVFFGTEKGGKEGLLFLEDPEGPMVIHTQVTSSGRYGESRSAVAAVRVKLERPYTLRVGPQSSLREGINNVLGGLDRGARMIGRKTGLHQDYGVPEITNDRRVKTSEPEFTRWVLQSRELRELLEAQPDFWVQVSPVGPEERIHLVEAQVSMEQEVSMRDEVFGLFDEMDQEARRKEYEDCGFPRQLDALVELARAVRDAVTAWPMPMKPL